MVRSMIIPYIDYASLFVSTTSDAQINKIQISHNKIPRVALKSHRLTRIKELNHMTGILLLKDRIIKFVIYKY